MMLRPAMFPSTSTSIASNSTSLNATQRRAATPVGSNSRNFLSKNRPNNEIIDPRPNFTPKDEGFFMQVEEELHDLRRVHAHGQEDDLRMALERCMGRVEEFLTLLTSAYTTFADLRIELDVTRSNLQMITANNEMLEDALKNLSSQRGTNPRDVASVGWRRSTPTSSTDLSHSENLSDNTPPSSPPLPASHPPPPPQESRFFKFRFNSSSISSTSSANNSRPQTPIVGNESPTIGRHRTASASSVSVVPNDDSSAAIAAQLEDLRRNFDVLKTQVTRDKVELETHKELLAAEKSKRTQEELRVTKVVKEKEALEAELESLSQALFEEANNMVATERRLRAKSEDQFRRQKEELQEELREAQAQREALQSALKIIENEMGILKTGEADSIPPLNLGISEQDDGKGLVPDSGHYNAVPNSDSRSSSREGIKSPPSSRPASRQSTSISRPSSIVAVNSLANPERTSTLGPSTLAPEASSTNPPSLPSVISEPSTAPLPFPERGESNHEEKPEHEPIPFTTVDSISGMEEKSPWAD
ncbi:hypothetical protein BDP27DRAFT_1330517 [Rhodocollybia butyracea]|uniref:GDP/GTP exchange factor Sec2 N-terminal domain-containing protein n=1 Tax=Rhodocollybia butyracea TaxID=206335 RepID=A0A9P5U641_9AGAR|nr:hypothetical protein BDP27DRAFT_1330517 [Rhodocollybia butyracea]